MKTTYKDIMKKVIIFLIIAVIKLNTYSQVTAQDPTSLVQEFTVNLDKLGNAKLEVDQKMNATQWEYFKQAAIYNDPAIAKRDLERSMASYDVQDFKRDVDDLNRTVKVGVTVNGYAKYNGNGQWVLKIDSKDPQVTKLTDNSYMITGNTVMGSILVQQIYKIFFPSSASNVKQTTDEFGKAIFTYSSGDGFLSYLKWNNIVGFILLLIAVYIVARTPGQRPTLNTAKI